MLLEGAVQGKRADQQRVKPLEPRECGAWVCFEETLEKPSRAL